MYITLSIVALLVTTGFITLKHPIFGKAPSGKRLQKIQQSPNYKDGKFQNISFTPDLTEGYSFSGVLWDFMFKKHPNTLPVSNIPSVKTDIKSLPLDTLRWIVIAIVLYTSFTMFYSVYKKGVS